MPAVDLYAVRIDKLEDRVDTVETKLTVVEQWQAVQKNEQVNTGSTVYDHEDRIRKIEEAQRLKDRRAMMFSGFGSLIGSIIGIIVLYYKLAEIATELVKR